MVKPNDAYVLLGKTYLKSNVFKSKIDPFFIVKYDFSMTLILIEHLPLPLDR